MQRVRQYRFPRTPRGAAAWLLLIALGAAACGGDGNGGATPAGGAMIAVSGMVHGGQNPVAGAQVFAYQAGSSGYGKGERPIACTISDSVGRFGFGAASPLCAGSALPASLTCPGTGSPQLYFLAQGGNPGAGVNPALLMMAAVGNCNNLSSRSFVTINEVTTVASVWALNQFMNCSGGSVNGTSAGCTANSREAGATATNATGLANAMALTANLANPATGLAQTPVAGKTPPTSEINTLADILQDCVNSTGAASTACQNLFTCAVPGAIPKSGNLAPCTAPAGGVVPADTVTAALDIARNPVHNVTALFNLTSKAPAFTPPLAAAPSDWTVAMNYSGSDLISLSRIAIDAAGNAWAAGESASAGGVIKLNPTGGALNGAAGYTGGGLSFPEGIAIDPLGNAWIVNSGTASVTELNSTGAFLSGPTGFTGGGLSNPDGIAIDARGNAWIANTKDNIIEISPAGSFLSGPGGFTGGGLNEPNAIAIDAVGNVWVPNINGSSVTEIGPSGSFLSPTAGCPGSTNCGYTGGGIANPAALAIDPAGNTWVVNGDIASLTELTSSGGFLSPVSGCPGTTNCGYTGGGMAMSTASSIAIDSAGNSWVVNCGDACDHGNSSVTEISAAGVFLSPTSGCPGATNCGFKGGGISAPFGIAIDSAGDVWVSNGKTAATAAASLVQFIGAAGPVLTPTSACLKLNTGRAVCLP